MLTVEYLSALEKLGDGRATKLVVPTDFAPLLSLVSAIGDTTGRSAPGPGDGLRPRGGLPVPDPADRVEAPPPADAGPPR